MYYIPEGELAATGAEQGRQAEPSRSRRRFAPALLGLALGCVFAFGAASAGASSPEAGGTLRILVPIGPAPPLDPALSLPGALARDLWQSACATLYTFRDAPAPKGYDLLAEAAVGPPRVSRDRKTYVFTVRKGLRFSDGSALGAANFVAGLRRVLNPAQGSYGAFLFSDVKRITSRGRRVRVELTRPAGDLPMRMTLPYACPVPLGFPVNAAGVTLTAGSGPYRIARVTPGKEFVLTRNRYYRGHRPHVLSAIDVTIGDTLQGSIRAVESGQADVLGTDLPPELRGGLVRRFGINKRQLFRWSGTFFYPLVLNTSGPLFRNNVALRRAVNLAVDRTEIRQQRPDARIATRATDQILPSSLPGWTDRRLYPMKPNLARAGKLAKGHLRSGKATLYVFNVPWLVDQARVVDADLGKIGLEVTVKPLAMGPLLARAGTRGEPFDMLLTGYNVEYPDPADVIIRLLAGAHASRPTGNTNFAYFKHSAYDRRMAAANRLTGVARMRAFSKLDADLMRNQAPWAPLIEGSTWILLSRRVGCFKPHPVYLVDLPAVCIR